MLIRLPDVTLVAIDAAAHVLTKLALEDTLAEISPAQIYIFSDQREIYGELSRFCVKTPKFSSAQAVDEFWWYELPNFIETSHYLMVQYDGWVRDGTQWNPEFLDYDYIGAPWHWHRYNQVGNGGFSLRSKRLVRFLRENRAIYPCKTPEDDTLCRTYRPVLEAEGFRFAPVELARQFSFEREPPRPSFGFHGLFNFPNVLDPQRFAVRIAVANDYVRSKVEWREIMGVVHGYSYAATESRRTAETH